jgi:hypothetical protein
LAAAVVENLRLWTADAALAGLAIEIGVAYGRQHWTERTI